MFFNNIFVLFEFRSCSDFLLTQKSYSMDLRNVRSEVEYKECLFFFQAKTWFKGVAMPFFILVLAVISFLIIFGYGILVIISNEISQVLNATVQSSMPLWWYELSSFEQTFITTTALFVVFGGYAWLTRPKE